MNNVEEQRGIMNINNPNIILIVYRTIIRIVEEHYLEFIDSMDILFYLLL